MSNDILPKQESPWPRAAIVAVRVVAVIVVIAGVMIAVISFPRYLVCDQQLSMAGKAVRVCRHLSVKDPPVIAVGLIVLAALGVFFPEISVLGMSLKRGMAEAKETARNAEVVANRAEDSALVAEAVSLNPSKQDIEGAPEPSDRLSREIRVLADQYNETRRAMPSGTERTSKMTSIIARMISLLNNVSQDQFDVSAHLNDKDPGMRLAGYAYLYANPDPRLVQENTIALLDEDKPFAQYWALRALHRQVESDPNALDMNTRRRLTELLTRLGPRTDRAYELREILGSSRS